MSELYSSIPDNKKQEYHKNAEAVIREATDPVIGALGQTVVSDAEDIVAGSETIFGPAHQAKSITELDAQAPKLADEAEAFAHDNDFQLEDGFSSGIADEADNFLRHRPDIKPGRPDLKPGYSYDHSAINHLKPKERDALGELDKPAES